MPTLLPGELEAIERALTLQGEWAPALAAVRNIQANLATDAEIAAARLAHQNDECEIDDGASTSRAGDGYWVQAWVWVTNEEID